MLLGALALLSAGATASERSDEIQLSEAERRLEVVRKDASDGRLDVLGTPLAAQIAFAWGFHPLDVVYRTELPLDALLDTHVRAQNASMERAEQLLRELLQTSYGFRARRVTRHTHVSVIRRLPDWPELEPSQAETLVEQRPGRLSATGAPIEALVAFLRPLANQPVVDETQMGERYDFVLEWDPSSEPYSLVQAFGDLGLELVFEKREVPFLVVEQAR